MSRVLDKDVLVGRLESMLQRRARHSDAFDFEFYLGLTFASDNLVNELAPIVAPSVGEVDEQAFVNKMHPYKDRFSNAPAEIRKSVAHYLGRRHGRLQSFSDVAEVLSRLKK